MEFKTTSDSPSWTHVSQLREELEGIEKIINKFSNFPVNIGICVRCLDSWSGWKSGARYYSSDNFIYIDIVTQEIDYKPYINNVPAQRKIIGQEFYNFFPKAMKKYEKRFPSLRDINPYFMDDLKHWLIINHWIDSQ